jgi:hypothetical protein
MRKLLLMMLAAAPAFAQELKDPWVPPQLKRSTTYVETRGDALRAQVDRKLREQFETADIAKTGVLTRAQAQAAGLGYIAENFDAIDRARSGFVRFEDVQRYLENASATTPGAARAGPGAAR